MPGHVGTYDQSPVKKWPGPGCLRRARRPEARRKQPQTTYGYAMQSHIQCANFLGIVQSRLPHTHTMCHVYPVGRLEEDGPEVSLWCGSIVANVKQQHRPRPQLLMSADVMQSGLVGQSI